MSEKQEVDERISDLPSPWPEEGGAGTRPEQRILLNKCNGPGAGLRMALFRGSVWKDKARPEQAGTYGERLRTGDLKMHLFNHWSLYIVSFINTCLDYYIQY